MVLFHIIIIYYLLICFMLLVITEKQSQDWLSEFWRSGAVSNENTHVLTYCHKWANF